MLFSLMMPILSMMRLGMRMSQLIKYGFSKEKKKNKKSMMQMMIHPVNKA